MTSYDWIDEEAVDLNSGRPAVLVADSVTEGPSPTTLITPAKNNLHRVVAITPSAFLDVLTPCYGDGERDCHYFTLGSTGNPKAESEQVLLKSSSTPFFCVSFVHVFVFTVGRLELTVYL